MRKIKPNVKFHIPEEHTRKSVIAIALKEQAKQIFEALEKEAIDERDIQVIAELKKKWVKE